jgi:peptidoglycan/LPS O-acetylase OafA/YrhL
MPTTTPRNRYLNLDGVRGLAALAVVVFHFSDRTLLPHAYLAVDFFFLLSGFVVAAAYEDRLRQGASVGWFFGVRMARLYPLYVVSMLIPFILLAPSAPGEMIKVLLTQMLGLPYAIPGMAEAYPLNGVMWSLALEMFVNVAFAAGGFRLSNRWLATIAVVSGLTLLWLALQSPFHSAEFGWRSEADDWLSGFTRVFLSFPIGVIFFRLHRAGRLPRPQVPGWLVIATGVAILAQTNMNPVYDAAVMGLVLPTIFVLLLAQPEPKGRLAKACYWSGVLSYPLYAAHVPMIAVARCIHELTGWPTLPVAVVGTLLLVRLFHAVVEPHGKTLIERIAREFALGGAANSRGVSPA